MARKPRLHVPGAHYHVMLRGNGGQAIFYCDEDREHLLGLLQEGVARFGHRVHAFCLMDNHLHLALQVGEVPLSRIMQNLAFRHTRWINRRQDRIGHLFQGRYRAILVDGDAYALELVRYIHLNPVRAGLVSDPLDYPWSAHRAYRGKQVLPWLTTDWVLGQFAERLGTARRRYAAFVRAGMGEGHQEAFHRGGTDGRVLGDDGFTARVLAAGGQTPPAAVPNLDALVEAVCQVCELQETDLADTSRRRRPAQARALIGWLATERQAATLTEVASRFGRSVGTLSEAVRRIREGAADPEVVRRVQDRLDAS